MLDGLMPWLQDLASNPWSYLTFFFIFCVLAAVILPIPVELGLLGLVALDFELFGLNIFASILLLSLIMGLGKAVGSWVVFWIGIKIEYVRRRWFKWGWFRKLVELMTRFCVRFSYMAVFIILAIPAMTDTVPLYIFSLLNKDGEVFEMKWFVMTNFWAGVSRGILVGIMVSAGLWMA